MYKKLIWKYANWKWRIIIILGFIAIAYLFMVLGEEIGRVIWPLET